MGSRIEDRGLPIAAVPVEQSIAVPPQGPQVEPRDRGHGVVPERDARREVQSEWGGLDQGGGQTQCWNQRRAYDGPRHGEEGVMSLRCLLFHPSLGVARVDANRWWWLVATRRLGRSGDAPRCREV